MDVTWKYWTHVRLEASGNLRRQEIAVAKTFFHQQFPSITNTALSDSHIQQHLVQISRSNERTHLASEQATGGQLTSEQALAESCLRCFISHQIPQICLNLERRFGIQGRFSRTELLPYVLDDVNPLTPFPDRAFYQPLAVKIVHTFNPTQSSLSTWTRRLVWQHKDLNTALMEHGIYLASNWAILSHTTPARVQRILSSLLTAEEIQQVCHLLESFHAVYRYDRIQQRSLGLNQRCSEPTMDQLRRMVLDLQHRDPLHFQTYSPAKVLQDLSALAQKLRRFRKLPEFALGNDHLGVLSDRHQLQLADQDQIQDEFLTRYLEASEDCLRQAVQQVIDHRLTNLRSQKPRKGNQILPKDQAFLKALYLFYCEAKSMADIAPLVGLEKQFQVTRLLELKELRAVVRRLWLSLIRDRLATLIEDYLESDQANRLDPHLDGLLEDLIDRMIAEDETDSYNHRRGFKSKFTASLSHYLTSAKFHPILEVKCS